MTHVPFKPEQNALERKKVPLIYVVAGVSIYCAFMWFAAYHFVLEPAFKAFVAVFTPTTERFVALWPPQ